MPNLVGYWNPESPEEAVRIAVNKQLQRVRIENVVYTEYTEIRPGFGVGLQDHGLLENGRQPAISDDGRVSLILDGEIYNADSLIRKYRNDLPDSPINPPELCLRLILKHGADVADEFNGLFTLTVYDRRDRRLTLVSDHLGFRPLFYVQRKKEFIFGTELKALSVIDPGPRKIDELGTFERFCYGSHVIDRTWMENYYRLPPAAILTVDEFGIKIRSYWHYHYDESAPILDQPTYFTNFARLLDRAVERRMQGTRGIGVFLSGGYDSRSVAASIRSHHLPIPAFTFGYPESRDVRFAAMLSERLGLDHYPLVSKGPYLFRNCPSIIWRTEGLLSFANATSIHHHLFFKDRKVDIILVGLLGEFSGSHTWPKLLLARSRREAMSVIMDRMLGNRLELARRIFKPSFFEANFEALQARFTESFENIRDDHPLNMADSWNLINRQPLNSWQSPSIDRYLFEIRTPLMDIELVKFLLTIPPYSRLEQRVYKKMIAYSFPKIRNVPCTNSAMPINPNFAREYAAMAARYLGRKTLEPLKKILNFSPSLGREFQDLGDAFRKEPEVVERILRPLLDEGVFPDGIFSRTGIEGIIDDHYRRNANYEEMLSLMISWGLAVKFFLHDDYSSVPQQFFKG